MPSEPLRVLVVGGGIGGLCLAQGLKKAGVSVAVYERDRSPAGRLGGFRIHINPDGSGALHECLPPAAWEAFVSTAGEPGGLGFLTEELEELTVIEEESARPGAEDPAGRSHAADRVTLRQVLLTDLEDVLHFGKEFERYERSPGGEVIAHFADGTSATGDVLVGADGANSRVREQHLPRARKVETGATGIGLKLPLTDRTRGWLPPRILAGMNMVIAPAPYFLFTSVFERRADPADTSRGPGLQAVFGDGDRGYQDYVLCAFVARRDALPPGVRDLDGPGLMRVVGAKIEHWHPDLRRLVAEADPDSAWVGPHVASVPVSPWGSTNVTLLGDAIHAMPPVGGLGGNTALRDARLLCRTMGAVQRGEAPTVSAVRAYEAEMLDYGFAAVRTALRYQRQGLRSSRVATAGARTWFRTLDAVSSLRR
jgi:2-polyprenyl-6-methoxyphenol hydroxylase-like FAD-dependent oxidoreductase